MRTFKLEDYLGKYEFSAPYLLCCSDAESFSMNEVIEMADQECIDLWSNMRLSYTEVPGLPLLREEISRMYNGLSRDNIFTCAGAEDAIYCTIKAIVEKNDHVIVLTPCYQSLFEIPYSIGADVTQVVLSEQDKWRIDVKKIAAEIRHNTKCVIINFPHNPTGSVISDQEMTDLANLLDKNGIFLISDEVYRLLGATKKWSNPACVVYDNAISIGVMSKAFGMAGLRIGWVATKNKEVMRKIELYKHYTSICNSGPSEVLSLISLRNKDKILTRNNEIVEKNLTIIDGFLNKNSDLFSWVRPEGGCVGFIRYKSEESASDFCDRLVKERGALLMPSKIYDFIDEYFRIGFGRINMPQSLEILSDFLIKS